MATLFGHLAVRFGSAQAENLATEGLHYILEGNAEARRLLARFLGQSGVPVPTDLHFTTQVTDEDGAIPDLVGRDASGTEVAILEAKFWAGLTDRQPNAYLNRLEGRGGLLLFVAPALRFESLWPELLHRCGEGGHALGVITSGTAWRTVSLGEGLVLGMTSWVAVLETLHVGLVAAGEPTAASDVLQLRGLTDRMDAEAFIPFRSEELTANTGRRVLQLCTLVDQTIDNLKASGLADTRGCRASGGRSGSYSRPFHLYHTGATLYFDPEGWAHRGIPLTLAVGDDQWGASRAVAEALRPLGNEVPPRLIVHPEWGSFVPIRVPAGVEWDQVLAAVVGQIHEVAALVRCVLPTGSLLTGGAG